MSKTKAFNYFPEDYFEKEDNNPPTREKLIMVQSRDVYGVTKVYPMCKDALHFAAIAGTTILTTKTLTNILKLGYEIIYTS